MKLTTETKTASVGALLLTLAALVFLLLAIAWPLFFIWALNTLFLFTIPYTFWTWLACWILLLTFQGAINVRNEKVLSFKNRENK